MAAVRPELTLLVIALLALLPFSHAQAGGFQYTVLQCTFGADFDEALPNQDAVNSLKAGLIDALVGLGISNEALALGEPYPRGSNNRTAIQVTVSDVANGQSVYGAVSILTSSLYGGSLAVNYDPSDSITSNATIWMSEVCSLGGFMNSPVPGASDCNAIATGNGPVLPPTVGPTGADGLPLPTGPAGPGGNPPAAVLGVRLSFPVEYSTVAPEINALLAVKSSLASQILSATGYDSDAIFVANLYGFMSTTYVLIDFHSYALESAESVANTFLTAISGDFEFTLGGSNYTVTGKCRSNPVVLALLQLPTCNPDTPVDPPTGPPATASSTSFVIGTFDEELLMALAGRFTIAENLADIERQQMRDAIYASLLMNPQPQAASLVTILQDNGLVPSQPDPVALSKASLMLVDEQQLANIHAARADVEYRRYQPIDEYLILQIAAGMVKNVVKPTADQLSDAYWAFMTMKLMEPVVVPPTKEEAIYDLLHPVYSRVTREHTAQMARLMWDDFNCNYPDGNTQGNLIYCETSQNTYVMWQFLSFLNLGPPADPNKELGEWTINFVDDWHVEWTYVWSPSTASGNSLSVGLTVFGVILAVIGLIGIVVAVALMSSRAAKERHNRRISTAHLSTPVKMQSLPRESWVEGIDV
eukprot:m.124424 g.124424  ORF g.124424 m.124424 type:complete len:646 (+) comp52179_c0_seq1:876-2813(+)